ncbi:hypothetical protein CsSME_00030707 [Camellia sinensis var. sinensis]
MGLSALRQYHPRVVAGQRRSRNLARSLRQRHVQWELCLVGSVLHLFHALLELAHHFFHLGKTVDVPEHPGRDESPVPFDIGLTTVQDSKIVTETLTRLPKATCPSSPKLPRLGNLGTIGEGHFVSTPARPIKDRPLLTMISIFENIMRSYSGY